MLLFQALWTFLRRSIGNLVGSIFGWAVFALFGEVSPEEKNVYSALVGAAASWPLLILGVVFPKAGALLLGFLPIPKWVPANVVRAVWIILTCAVPFLVGLAFVHRAGPNLAREPAWKRWLLGFPITVGLAAAFLLAAFGAPIRRVAAAVKGRKDEHVPLILPIENYGEIVEQLRLALRRGGLPVRPARPGWGAALPPKVLRFFGGVALERQIPPRIAFFRGRELEVTVYPNGISLLGHEKVIARAHALIIESAGRTQALQTSDPAAQQMEHRIKQLWSELDQGASDRRIHDRLARLIEDTANLEIGFDDWERIYREALRLIVEVEGGRSIVERGLRARRALKLRGASTRRLTRGLTTKAQGIARQRVLTSASTGLLDVAQGLTQRFLSAFRLK